MANVCCCAAMPNEPKGIGGWMILPMLGTIIAPLISIHDIFYGLDKLAEAGASGLSSQWKTFIWISIVVAGLMAGAWIYAAFQMFQHKRTFPVLFVSLLATSLVLSLAATIVAAQLFNVAPDDVSARDTIRPLIALVIFGPYMYRSKRVKNTFVE